MEAKWTVLLMIWGLVSGGMPLNWMAGGTFTQAEFATLRGKVDTFDLAADPATFAAAA